MTDLPVNGIGQSCAWCGAREVAWVHPLVADRVRYRAYGEGRTLPGFWTLCERCEGVYQLRDDEAAVEVMLASSEWSWVQGDLDEVRQPLDAFRRADLGGRRLEPEPPAVSAARSEGFVPLRELTGVADTLGRQWPPEHRLWLEDLGAAPGEDEDDEPVDRWLVRSPWPSLSVDQTLHALWRWVDQAAGSPETHGRDARTEEFFEWTAVEVATFLGSDP
jgi:hypothetical protein